MERSNPTLRLALLIQRQLTQYRQRLPGELQSAALHVLDRQQMIHTTWRQLLKAHQRGWHRAAGLMQARVFQQAHLLCDRLTNLLHLEHPHGHGPPALPTLAALVQEIRQVQSEFETVELDPRGQTLTAWTPSIELEGITLGPFRIQLHIDRLGRRFDSGCFDCIAVEPCAASSDDAVTHPHVRDRSLCAGEAAVPLSQALRQGRIADAFCIVHSVLKTYNPHSPYVQLSDWDGVACPECGGSVSPDDLYRCQACDQDFCENCSGRCDLCEDSTCRGCLERDPVTHRHCCPSCRHTCNQCGRVVECDEFDEQTGLCPACGPQPGDDDSAMKEP